MKTIFSKILRVLYSILLIIATFCSIYTSIPSIKRDLLQMESSWERLFLLEINWWMILSILLVIFILYCYYKVSTLLSKLGVRKVPCSLKRLIRYKHHKNYIKCAERIHSKILYLKTEALDSIHKHPQYRLRNEEVNRMIDKLLQEFHLTLNLLTGVDFSINIKLFRKGEQTDEYIAYTYRRFPGTIEIQRYENEEIRQRYDNEEFLVKICREKDLNRVHSLIENHINDGLPYKRCLAYDYAMNSKDHFWISNDLEKDKKRNFFLSSSNDYDTFYKSMAVFLISSPLIGKSNSKNTAGLLIVDSSRTNVFIKKEARYIIGFMAHTLYEIFNVLMERDKV